METVVKGSAKSFRLAPRLFVFVNRNASREARSRERNWASRRCAAIRKKPSQLEFQSYVGFENSRFEKISERKISQIDRA